VLLVISLAGLGLAAGALWEVYEWIRDIMFPEENLTVGKVDTMVDLIFDTLGALLGATVAVVLIRRHPHLRHGAH
jgi:glycopeptide antibiotics resistance protein